MIGLGEMGLAIFGVLALLLVGYVAVHRIRGGRTGGRHHR